MQVECKGGKQKNAYVTAGWFDKKIILSYYVVRQIKRGLILQIKTDFFNRLAMV